MKTPRSQNPEYKAYQAEYYKKNRARLLELHKEYRVAERIEKQRLKNEPHEITIYLLLDPRTSTPMYIGETTELSKRIHNHLNNAHKYTNKNARWLMVLKSLDLKPTVEVIDTIVVKNRKESIVWEQYYISLYRSWGFDLNNRVVANWKPYEKVTVRKKRISKPLSEAAVENIKAANAKRRGIPLINRQHMKKRAEVFASIYSERSMEDVCELMSISPRTYKVYYQLATGNKFKKKYMRKNKTHDNI